MNVSPSCMHLFSKQRVWTSTIVAPFFLTICLLPGARTQGEIPTADQLRDATQGQRDTVRTLRLRERETVEIAERPGYSEARDSELITEKLKPSQRDRVDVAGIVTARQLNRHLSADVERVVDRQAAKVRVVVVDTRDTASLAQQYRLSSMAENNLDRSRTIILEGLNHTVMPTGKQSAVVRHEGGGDLSKHLDLDRLGIIPRWVFDEGFSLEISSQGESTYRIVGRYEARRAFEVVVDGTKDCRVASLVRFDDQDRPVETRTYSDYERVDGQWVPKIAEERVTREGITDFAVTRWQLMEVQVNPEVPPATFRIPEGYHVQYLPGTRSQG